MKTNIEIMKEVVLEQYPNRKEDLQFLVEQLFNKYYINFTISCLNKLREEYTRPKDIDAMDLIEYNMYKYKRGSI